MKKLLLFVVAATALFALPSSSEAHQKQKPALVDVVKVSACTNEPSQVSPACLSYEVKKGDVLERIAQVHGLKLEEILALSQNEHFKTRPVHPSLKPYSSRGIDWIFPKDVVTLPYIDKKADEIAETGKRELAKQKVEVEQKKLQKEENRKWWGWVIISGVVLIFLVAIGAGVISGKK